MLNLIPLSENPSMPAPWSSTTPGETWSWGKYFVTFQSKPKSVLQVAAEMQGGTTKSLPIEYLFCMTVFYNLERNPYGKSKLPIMSIAMERANYESMRRVGADFQKHLKSNSDVKYGPVMLGQFTSQGRINFGEYDGSLHPDSVKQRFFEILQKQTALTGSPRKIGSISDAYGHPDTGLPSKKSNSGCLVAALIVGTLLLFAASLAGSDIW